MQSNDIHITSLSFLEVIMTSCHHGGCIEFKKMQSNGAYITLFPFLDVMAVFDLITLSLSTD